MKDKTLFVSLFSFKFTCFLLVIIVSTLAFFYRISSVEKADEKAYSDLMSAAQNKEGISNPYTAKQERLDVQKDFFFHKNEAELKLSLKAKRSDLVLDHSQDKTHFIEKMKQVKCLMQEELYYLLPDGKEAVYKEGKLVLRHAKKEEALDLTIDTPGIKKMQVVRLIEANDAEYHYKGDLFVADQVKISRYLLPGHHFENFDIKGTLLMNGISEKVEFTLKSKSRDFDFKATKLKATFYEFKGMHL